MDEYILEYDQNENEIMKAVDPLQTQDQDPKETLDQEEDENVAISITNDEDEESVEDTEMRIEYNDEDRVTGVWHSSRMRTKNCRYFNPDTINTMIKKRNFRNMF